MSVAVLAALLFFASASFTHSSSDMPAVGLLLTLDPNLFAFNHFGLLRSSGL